MKYLMSTKILGVFLEGVYHVHLSLLQLVLDHHFLHYFKIFLDLFHAQLFIAVDDPLVVPHYRPVVFHIAINFGQLFEDPHRLR